MKLNKRECGRRGGRATFARHGRAHMQTIGRRGAATFWRRYHMAPVGTSQWAIVKRTTGEVVNFIGAISFQMQTAASGDAHGG
jgi:general stress protein YciG